MILFFVSSLRLLCRFYHELKDELAPLHPLGESMFDVVCRVLAVYTILDILMRVVSH